MVEETVSGTGVTGNTPAATQTAAQQSASAARNALKKDWQTKGKNYVIALTISLLLIALSRLYDWSFFWLITVGSLLYIAASRVSDPVAKGPYKDLLPWVHFGKILGVILVVGSVLSSSFVAYLAMTVNDVEKAVDKHLMKVEESLPVGVPKGAIHIIAPTDKWSNPIQTPQGTNPRWQGDDPTGDWFEAKYWDADGNERIYKGGKPLMRAIAFRSTGNKPVNVYLTK